MLSQHQRATGLLVIDLVHARIPRYKVTIDDQKYLSHVVQDSNFDVADFSDWLRHETTKSIREYLKMAGLFLLVESFDDEHPMAWATTEAPEEQVSAAA